MKDKFEAEERVKKSLKEKDEVEGHSAKNPSIDPKFK
jgi:hypothetical protein